MNYILNDDILNTLSQIKYVTKINVIYFFYFLT